MSAIANMYFSHFYTHYILYEEKIKFLIEILKKVVDKAGKDLII